MMKCKLEDIADVTMGQSPKSEFYNSDGEGMPFLQGNRTFGTMYPTFDTYTTKVTKMAKAGDVIMSVRAPVGDLNFTPVDMCLGRGVCGIRMKNGNQNFLFYLLKYYMPLLINKESGTVFGSVNRNDINGLEVDIPEDESDQKIIARYLAMLDDMIEENEKINKNLLQQVSAIFKHWFTENPSLDALEQVPLADLCLVVTKGTTPTTLGKQFVSEGINFIKAESILGNHTIDKDKFAFIDIETNDLMRRSIISSGDILFTIAGSLGRFALIDDSVLPANTNQAVAIIRANQSKVTPEYLYSFFLGNWHNDYYTKRIQQAVQANLSLGTIKSLPIPILSDKAMQEYLGIISPIIAMTKANELEISRLRTIRDALLPQLMSGQLDVSRLDL